MITVKTTEVPKNTLIGFKTLPTECIDDTCPKTNEEIRDWSAIYPQLWFKQAINYLPNQWDRGASSAVVVALYNITPLRICTINSPDLFTSNKSSHEKAAIVREALRTSLDLDIPTEKPLMRSVGAAGYVLCLPDAENFELIFPHELFVRSILNSEPLFSFKQSERRPFTVESVLQYPSIPQLHQQEQGHEVQWGESVPVPVPVRKDALLDAILLGETLTEIMKCSNKPVECTKLISLLGF